MDELTDNERLEFFTGLFEREHVALAQVLSLLSAAEERLEHMLLIDPGVRYTILRLKIEREALTEMVRHSQRQRLEMEARHHDA